MDTIKRRHDIEEVKQQRTIIMLFIFILGMEQKSKINKSGHYKSIISILDKIDRNQYFSRLIDGLISKIDNN